jgi:hypothetical protein
LTFGTAISPDEITDKSDDELMAQITAEIAANLTPPQDATT